MSQVPRLQTEMPSGRARRLRWCRAGPRSLWDGDRTGDQPKDGDKIAVLPFATTGVGSSLGDGVAEMVVSGFRSVGLVIIERRNQCHPAARHFKQQAHRVRCNTGWPQPECAQGPVRKCSSLRGGHLHRQVRIVDVETQRVRAREASCEHCKEQDLPRTVAALRRIIVR